jgi:hypothetical protein
MARLMGRAFAISLIVSGMVFIFDRPVGRPLLGWIGAAWFFIETAVLAGFLIWFLSACAVAIVKGRS